MIVLGCGKIMRENRRRAIHAARIAKARKCKVIVSGNQQVNGKTEAEYMGDIAELHSIDRQRIFVDSEAYNTVTNLAYARTLIEASNKKNIVLVTGRAHMPRVFRTARQMYPGCNIVKAPTPISSISDLGFEFAESLVEILSSVANCRKMMNYLENHGSLDGFSGVRMIYNSRE